MPTYKVNDQEIVADNIDRAVKRMFGDALAFAHDDYWVVLNGSGETVSYGEIYPADDEAEAELNKEHGKAVNLKIRNLRDNYFFQHFRKKPSNKPDDGYDIGVLVHDFAFYLRNEFEEYIEDSKDDFTDNLILVMRALLMHFPAKFLYDEMKRVIDTICYDNYNNYRMFVHSVGVRFCALLEAYSIGIDQEFGAAFNKVYEFFFRLAKRHLK